MKNSLIALVFLALVGCASTNQSLPQLNVVPVKSSETIPVPKVESTNLQEINFNVLNKTQLVNFSTTGNKSEVLYVLDEHNVQLLFGNIQELRRYIRSQHEVIKYLTNVLNNRSGTQEVK